MSTATQAPKSKSKKDKRREAADKPHPGTERLKTVVRRLPPNLPEDVFWGSVAPWVTDETASWKIYYPGKLKKRVNKENIPSRAYIAFKTEELLTAFGREYDGHLFRDKAGNEYQAVVEFAPYQKVPSEKKKVDARNATIEKDEDYISFIASLKAAENAEPPTLEALLAAAQPPPAPKSTPLLEALKAEKTAQKDKEAILRSHAHYNPSILAPPPRADTKKKGAAAAAKPAPAPEPSSSKKGKKGSAQNQPTKQPPQPQTPAKQPAAPANANQGSSKPPKAPRPPKPPKQPQQEQQQASKAPNAASPAPPVPTIVSAPASGAPGTSTPASAPRRTRPVIGLASRQFEAALSGVGGGRGRREPKDGANGEGQSAAPPAKAAGQQKHKTPKEKEASVASSASVPGPTQIPGILQPPVAVEAQGDGRMGGGKRGHGRGRGGGRGGGPTRVG